MDDPPRWKVLPLAEAVLIMTVFWGIGWYVIPRIRAIAMESQAELAPAGRLLIGTLGPAGLMGISILAGALVAVGHSRRSRRGLAWAGLLLVVALGAMVVVGALSVFAGIRP